MTLRIRRRRYRFEKLMARRCCTVSGDANQRKSLRLWGLRCGTFSRTHQSHREIGLPQNLRKSILPMWRIDLSLPHWIDDSERIEC